MIIPALDLIDGTVVRLHQATTPGSGTTVTIPASFTGLRCPGRRGAASGRSDRR